MVGVLPLHMGGQIALKAKTRPALITRNGSLFGVLQPDMGFQGGSRIGHGLTLAARKLEVRVFGLEMIGQGRFNTERDPTDRTREGLFPGMNPLMRDAHEFVLESPVTKATSEIGLAGTTPLMAFHGPIVG